MMYEMETSWLKMSDIFLFEGFYEKYFFALMIYFLKALINY